MPIFSELPAQTLQSIAQRIVLQHASAGDRIYRVGEVGDARTWTIQDISPGI